MQKCLLISTGPFGRLLLVGACGDGINFIAHGLGKSHTHLTQASNADDANLLTSLFNLNDYYELRVQVTVQGKELGTISFTSDTIKGTV